MINLYIVVFELLGTIHWVEVLPTYKQAVDFTERKICRDMSDQKIVSTDYEKKPNWQWGYHKTRLSWVFKDCAYHVLERRIKSSSDDITPMSFHSHYR